MTRRIAVILSGQGGGARLGGEYLPKPLLTLGGKPLLEHQLDWLRRADFSEAVLCLGYGAERVRGRFGDGSRWGFKLRYLVEETPLGSAGAVKSLGPASLPEDVLVLSGDVFPETELFRMLEFHDGHAGLATVAARPPSSPTDTLVVMGPEGAIVDLPPAPLPGHKPLAAAPLWVIRRKLLHFVPDRGPSDFLRDVVPAAVKAGESLFLYLERGLLSEIGSPELRKRFSARVAKR